MSSVDRGSLRAAFSQFKKPDAERDAERKLLGREVEPEPPAPEPLPPVQVAPSYQVEAAKPAATTGLIPRPLLKREPVRQISLRCPISLASELRRKAEFNQLEQQEIIIEGLRRVLAELPDPPPGWQP